MRGVVVVLTLVAVGCLQSGTVPCGDRTCPANTICEEVTRTCISSEMASVCREQNIADGDLCSGPGFTGICDRAKCLPGCGDGVARDDVEECDDGNFRSHDGCSSSCTVEVPSWKEVEDRWHGVFSHAAAVQESNGTLVVFGGQSTSGLRNEMWIERGGLLDSWRDLTNPSVPPARYSAMMEYDRLHNVLVLFGGADNDLFGDTWEYTLVGGLYGTWTHRTDVGGPPPRFGGAMTYDASRDVIVLYGGFGIPAGSTTPTMLSDTWEYNGTSWINRTTGTTPGPRYYHGLAFDPNINKTVLYGGIGSGSETWEYSNGVWTQGATAPTGLGVRASVAVTYSPARGRVVLFGGIRTNGLQKEVMNDTWEYSGGTWSTVYSARVPPPRSQATLTGVQEYTVLIGGAGTEGTPPLSDVWNLDATGWHDVTPHLLPPARYSAPIVYDEDTRELLLIGGVSSSDQLLAEQWTFGEGSWGRTPTAGSSHYHHALAYDPKRKRVVQFGGVDSGGVDNDTWELTDLQSHTWTLMSPPTSPSKRMHGVLAFDGDVLVYFGGVDGVSNTALGETWTYDGTTWTKETQPGPAITSRAAAAYDPVHARLVLFDRDGVTWSHHGGAWTKLADKTTDGSTPAGRVNASMTFDWQTKRILLMGGANEQLFTDVWELDDATWRQLYVPGGGPLPRMYFGLASNASARETFLIAGAGAGLVTYGDMWGLQYRSTTPDEDCTNIERDTAGAPILDQDGHEIAIDDDGDHHANHHDPDCCANDYPNTCLAR